MSKLAKYIEKINEQKNKALAVFLTAGFPEKGAFVDLAVNAFNSGADVLEIGIPFSDPIADGPVIQKSSQIALSNGITLSDVLGYTARIKSKTDKPIILMGYANPILHFGLEKFIDAAIESGVDGLIVPDIPIEEYDDFWTTNLNKIDKILLTTPTSPTQRIQEIDKLSQGFVYCVSVTGTTGIQQKFENSNLANLKRTYDLINRNKMLIGFGISGPEVIKTFSPFCDGVIVGSAIINQLLSEKSRDYRHTLNFINSLSNACKI
jgi:tryptophan synthase alpha chain